MGIDWMGVLLILILVFLNAFFAASEIAVISARRVRIQRLKEKGSKSAKIVLRLMKDPSLFLATIQVGITLSGFLASATAAIGISQTISDFFQRQGLPAAVSKSLSVLTVTVIISYITLVFGELAPKRLAMHWSEKISLFVAKPIDFMAKITSPVTRFLTFSTNTIVRLFGVSQKKLEKEITEDEIRLYIAEHRSLPVEEKQMIEGVFNFGDQVVRQVMVPRTDIYYLKGDYDIRQAMEKVCDTGYSKFPVYGKDYDDIIGMINVASLACKFIENNKQKVKEIMDPVLFVPETKPTVELLKEFHKKGLEMAVIVDEYGGTSGLVTPEDLIDEIIGDVIEEQKFIRKNKQGEWVVEGDTPIREIVETLDLKKIPSDTDYETVAGFLLEQFGALPQEGTVLYWEGYKFKVIRMGDKRIRKILVSSIKKD